MADGVTINGGKSAAEVAYSLLIAVADAEEKWTGSHFKNVDRAYLLDTYSECHRAARGARASRAGTF